jgi:hypothetical protein
MQPPHTNAYDSSRILNNSYGLAFYAAAYPHAYDSSRILSDSSDLAFNATTAYECLRQLANPQ